MFKVTEVCRTSWVCPSQWEGKTSQGDAVRVQYRWGTLTVYVGGTSVLSKHIGKPTTEKEDEIVYEQMRRQGWDENLIQRIKNCTDQTRKARPPGEPLCFDGLISYKEMKQHTAEMFTWPTEDTPHQFNCTKERVCVHS